ncbi:cell division protein ZapA [Aestuariispira insulae]|uniref:Cell division protein ZapA n=1 Tax=Aestuariispira insulae TaxID=1461337 RepID=A0A3D9HJY8_9PROT|nr:cell division protein ZapA [Aestuariispira insulae]RED49774.1 cell division protein ZapA [Aestuariispira insulae]
MSQVELVINGRTYAVTCDDGQEEHLRKLGGFLSSRVEELVGSIGQVGEARLMLMAGLMVADELSDAYGELEEMRQNGGGSTSQSGAEDENQALEMLDSVAERIEAIAARLEEA